MDFNSFCETPFGVLRRVAGNIPSAPDVYFITKSYVDIGNTPTRDVIFQWNESSLSVLVTKKYLAPNNTWKIMNQNSKSVFLNDKFLETQKPRNINSGDRIRFGLKESLHLIYSIHFYSEEHPATLSEMKSYLESTLVKFEAEADKMKHTCAKVMDNCEELRRDPRKKIVSDGGRPIAAFRLISSNVAAPPFHLLYRPKPIAVFGKLSSTSDVVIGSDECSWREAIVKQENQQWKITNESPVYRHFINEQYFTSGETLTIESQDRIRLGGTEKFDVIYEFVLYSTDVPLLDMMVYAEHSWKKFQKEAKKMNNTCEQIKSKLEKINESKFIKNDAVEKLKRTKETNDSGNKKIKTELLGDGNESAADKVKKSKENVSEDNKAMKTELGDESESTSVAAKVVQIKVEAVEDDCAKIKEKKYVKMLK